MKICRFFIFVIAIAATIGLSAFASPEPRVLVYTKNQIGTNLYVHDNIAACAEAIKKLGADNGFAVEVSNDPADFTDENLKKYRAIVFDNTNNEILETEEQKTALQRYIRGGGGFVGLHSASGSMRKWPWFWSMLGGKFVRHPKMQAFTVKLKDRTDISTAHLPETFQWTDEFYYVDNMPEGLHVLLAGDLTTLDDPGKAKYPGTRFGDEFPLAWRHEFEGGRAWYTALGHRKEHYSDPRLTKHILGGILWAMRVESVEALRR
ncbi:MAG TPA: ThuA domain-containing protein [Verrucomicrobiae bacterium]